MTTTTLENLERKLDKIRREQQFFRSIKLSEGAKTEANIDLTDHSLSITFDPDWLSKVQDKQLERYLQKKNIPPEKALEILLRDVLYHEIGHRGLGSSSGCPGDCKTLSEAFLEPVYAATKIEDKQQLMYLANLVMDLINNTSLRVSAAGGVTTLSGLYGFFKEQGRAAENSAGGKLSKLYEGYCRLNLYFNGDAPEKALLRQYLSYDPKVNKALQNFLQRTGLGAMKTETYQGSKTVLAKDREKQTIYLQDSSNWKNIAAIFAEEFGQFLEEKPREKPFGAGGSGSDNYESGDGQSGQGENSEQPQSGNSQDGSGGSGRNSSEPGKEESDAGDSEIEDHFDEAFSQYLDDLQNLFRSQDGFGHELNQTKTQKALQRGRKADNSPGWMTNYEHLVSLYELLASDKLFDLKTPPVPAKKYPLVGLGERRFEWEDDSFSDIDGMCFDPETFDMELTAPRSRFEIEAKVSESRNDHPDLVLAMLDTSGSMLEPMPRGPPLGKIVNPKGLSQCQWQYNSKYHVSLIAYFMMAERFGDLRINDADVHFVNFSSSTILHRGLKNSRYHALHPQFGGTSIDLETIEQVLSRRNQLVVTISDGVIGNSREVLKRFQEISQYNPYFHVQIGPRSSFSRALLKKGIQVKTVQSEQDLYEFVIDLLDTTYGET